MSKPVSGKPVAIAIAVVILVAVAIAAYLLFVPYFAAKSRQ